MKIFLILALLFPTLSFAGDCPWTVRKAVKNKAGALKKCGTPDFVSNMGSYQSGPYIINNEAWVYRNDDGSTTTITFSGNKRRDFDQKR